MYMMIWTVDAAGLLSQWERRWRAKVGGEVGTFVHNTGLALPLTKPLLESRGGASLRP
jgi:hypothetical protein